MLDEPPYSAAIQHYRQQLGLKPGQRARDLCWCSACSPVWYDEHGAYGVGPNPRPSPERASRNGGGGQWHGEFARHYLPKRQFETDRHGNLVHIRTQRESRHYWLDQEDPECPTPTAK